MNIVVIGPYPLSSDCIRGGVESSVYGLVKELSSRHNVCVLDFPRIGGRDVVERQEQLTIHRYRNYGRHNQDALRRKEDIIRDIVEFTPDIVHIHGTGNLSGEIYAAAQELHIPVLLTVHGLLSVEKKNILLRHPSLKHLYQYVVQSRAEKAVLNRAKYILVDTEYVARQIRNVYTKKLPGLQPWLYVVPQGIQTVFLNLQHKMSTDEQIILSVGAISRRKGHLYLIRAFKKVHDTIPAAKLIIAGSLAESSYLKQMQDEIEKLSLSDCIEMYTNIQQSTLLELYQRAYIFALHSQEESQGIALVEAMAVGLPVVSTMVGGIPDVVENEKTGLLSAYADADRFAANLTKLLQCQDLHNRMTISAQAAAKNYSWPNIAQTVETVYSKIVNSKI